MLGRGQHRMGRNPSMIGFFQYWDKHWQTLFKASKFLQFTCLQKAIALGLKLLQLHRQMRGPCSYSLTRRHPSNGCIPRLCIRRWTHSSIKAMCAKCTYELDCTDII
jgi:hypothetical protein